MKNIDHIIRYLAGEIEEDEKVAFEKRVTTDPEFGKQVKEVKTIWKVIKNELSLEDLTGKESKEELIAAVMAEQDIHEYGNRSPSENERSFMRISDELVNEAGSQGVARPGLFKPDFRKGLLLAAAVAVLLILSRPLQSPRRLADTYYKPTELALLEEQPLQTRNEVARAAGFFLDGNYKAARYFMEKGGIPGVEKPVTGLMYAISCYETSDTTYSIKLLKQLAAIAEAPVSYEARWYLSLILIRQNHSEMALPYLSELSAEDGKYREKSKKIIRRINRRTEDR